MDSGVAVLGGGDGSVGCDLRGILILGGDVGLLPPPLDEWVEGPLEDLARDRQSTEDGCLVAIIAVTTVGVALMSLVLLVIW